MQSRYLSSFLSHAARQSPYYSSHAWAERLRAGKTVELSEIAITSKDSVQADSGQFKAIGVPFQAGEAIEKSTSGSTGMPLKVYKSAVHFQVNAAENHRLKAPWKLTSFKKQLHFRIPNDENPPGTRRQETLANGIEQKLLYTRSPEAFLPIVNAREATFFSASANIVSTVLEQADPACGLQLVETYFEALPDNFPDLLSRIPGCRGADTYGSVETGLLAVSCPDCGFYHLAVNNNFIEILKPDGTAASEGELGRITITNFSNPAMPLIRYDLGDIVTYTRQSPCQPGAISLVKIHGRERMLFRLPGGGHILPSISSTEMLKMGVKRFRLVQVAPDLIEIHYMGHRPNWPLDAGRVQQLVAQQMSDEFRIVLKEVTSFPLATSGKYLMHERLF